MITLQRPTADEVHHFLRWQRDEHLSYPDPTASRIEAPPANFMEDRIRVRLGFGEEIFWLARTALCRWWMIPHFCRLCWPAAPIERGTVVATLSRVGPLWSLNACRIVYVLGQESVDDSFTAHDAPQRFGFAYGTLPGHILRGEERFTVEWLPEDDSVWYELYCFSRPRHTAARIAYPLVRWKQHQFRRSSAEAMRLTIHALKREPTPDRVYAAGP